MPLRKWKAVPALLRTLGTPGTATSITLIQTRPSRSALYPICRSPQHCANP